MNMHQLAVAFSLSDDGLCAVIRAHREALRTPDKRTRERRRIVRGCRRLLWYRAIEPTLMRQATAIIRDSFAAVAATR